MGASEAEIDRQIAILDCEASAFPMPGSYPIEVALAFVDTGTVRSWLIRPAEVWIERWLWDPASEEIHGISQAKLLAEGRPLAEVRVELAAAAAGHRVLSDALGADRYWLCALYGRPAPFQLASVYDVIEDLIAARPAGARPTAAEAEQIAAQRFPQQHRAGPDAQRWAEVIRILRGIA